MVRFRSFSRKPTLVVLSFWKENGCRRVDEKKKEKKVWKESSQILINALCSSSRHNLLLIWMSCILKGNGHPRSTNTCETISEVQSLKKKPDDLSQDRRLVLSYSSSSWRTWSCGGYVWWWNWDMKILLHLAVRDGFPHQRWVFKHLVSKCYDQPTPQHFSHFQLCHRLPGACFRPTKKKVKIQAQHINLEKPVLILRRTFAFFDLVLQCFKIQTYFLPWLSTYVLQPLQPNCVEGLVASMVWLLVGKGIQNKKQRNGKSSFG